MWKLELSLRSATPDPLADTDMKAISTSQGHEVPCHPIFLMAWPMHSRPCPYLPTLQRTGSSNMGGAQEETLMNTVLAGLVALRMVT